MAKTYTVQYKQVIYVDKDIQADSMEDALAIARVSYSDNGSGYLVPVLRTDIVDCTKPEVVAVIEQDQMSIGGAFGEDTETEPFDSLPGEDRFDKWLNITRPERLDVDPVILIEKETPSAETTGS